MRNLTKIRLLMTVILLVFVWIYWNQGTFLRFIRISTPLTRNIQCEETIHIAFVKVHKAGSTTLQNILQRFGLRRNLSFVLSNSSDPKKPVGFRHYLGWEGTIDIPTLLPLPKGKKHFDILTNHVVFNKSVFQEVMHETTQYIGIVREPFQQYRSTVSYYGYDKQFSSLATNDTAIGKLLNSPAKPSFLHSRMSFDFGLSTSLVQNMTAIEAFIGELDRTFKLVLILEYFDESLILLKRILCWEIKDIIYLAQNVNPRALPYSPKDLNKHKRLMKADYLLYDHFYRKFWKLVKNELDYGFADDVHYFKNVLRQVASFCASSDQVLTISPSIWSDSFTVTKEDCNLMHKSEIDFLALLTKLQINQL